MTGHGLKGVGTTVGTVIAIAIIIMYFGIYLYMQNNETQSSIRLNLESLEVLKLKSTFSLFNQSLGATWYLSTVQSIFQTADESVGCGIDDTRLGEGYWYQLKTNKERDGLTDGNNVPLERIPVVEKYNADGRNPQICYPRDEHVREYMTSKLGPFLRIRNPVDADGVTIEIERNSNDQNVVGSSIELLLNDNSVFSRFSQLITASYDSGRMIKQTTTNENTVSTKLRLLVAAGRTAVEKLLELGDSPPQYQFGDTRDSYTVRVENVIKDTTTNSLPVEILSTVTMKKELFAPNSSTANILPVGHGLIFHYDMTVRYEEGARATITQATLGWPTVSRNLDSCYGYRQLSTVDAGKYHSGIDIASSGSDEILSIDNGVVADVYNGCPVGSMQSECGKPGNTGYGNFVLIKHDGFYSFYGHLKKDSIVVRPGDSVSAGQQIATMGSSGHSSGVHLHFEIRTDPTVANRLDPCGYVDCSSSTNKVCQPASMINPSATSGVYYYYDDDTNTFEKRPISLQYKAEDYLRALVCTGPTMPAGAVPLSWQSSNDMICCAGYLFSCNADIPNLAASQTLVSGQSMGSVFPQTICDRAAGGIQCTPAGFVA